MKFLGEVDLWGMDLDKTIFFRRKEISVYPDDKSKPPQGQALNRRSGKRSVSREAMFDLFLSWSVLG